ncbi:MAG: hypothetical protein CFE45_18275 [Burkholderiales bacterium PBB5]|nr:MAG: hypothetical protein CFE45_18275 [Burkholderiales bacterium PBB5]
MWLMQSRSLAQQFTTGLVAVVLVAVAVLAGTRWLGKTARFHHLEREHLAQVSALAVRLQRCADGVLTLRGNEVRHALQQASGFAEAMEHAVWPVERQAFAWLGFAQIAAWPLQDMAALAALRAQVVDGQTVSPEAARQLLAGLAPVQAQADALGERVADAAGFVQRAVLLVNGLGLAVLVAVFLALRRATLRPLQQAVDAAQRMAGGDLTAPPPGVRDDEVGRLSAALQATAHNLGGVVQDVRGRLGAVAQGIAEVVAGSSDLAAQAHHQAHTLQTTATGLSRLSAAVQASVAQARQADGLAAQATRVAGEGGEAVGRMVERMALMLAASRRIADINGVVDNLAFRTNILALNAAVEAARAGDQGRGFAVVAAEVRSLAQRSAAAAREIAALVNETTSAINQGAAEVHTAGQTIASVVTAVTQVHGLAQGVASELAAQAQGMAEIDGAMARLGEATQHNAGLARQSQAAAQAMRGESDALVAAVGRFQLA